MDESIYQSITYGVYGTDTWCRKRAIETNQSINQQSIN